MARARRIDRSDCRGRQQLHLANRRLPTGKHGRDSLVSDHIRALMAPQPTDVVSSDPAYRQAVVQWPHPKIATCCRPRQKGFPAGWRPPRRCWPDPVPTLVYRHPKHLISLTEILPEVVWTWPRTPRTINGYNVVHWTENGVSYWAISDLAASKLKNCSAIPRYPRGISEGLL